METSLMTQTSKGDGKVIKIVGYALKGEGETLTDADASKSNEEALRGRSRGV